MAGGAFMTGPYGLEAKNDFYDPKGEHFVACMDQ